MKFALLVSAMVVSVTALARRFFQGLVARSQDLARAWSGLLQP